MKHKVVIYGGHPRWLKQIKGMFKGLRFAGDDGHLDYTQIPFNDMVVIYTQAVRHCVVHSCYHNAKKNHIPIETFHSTSAEKCAEELIKFDKALFNN